MNKSTVLIPIALILFLAAAVMIWRGLQSDTRAVPPSTASKTDVSVVVANSDIEQGHVLGAADLSLKSYDATQISAGTLRRISDAEGHAVLEKIGAGSPVVGSAISGMVISGISPRVPVGYRAFSIPVAEAAIAGGFLQAGDHVDLYVTLPGALFGQDAVAGGRSDDQSKSTLLLQGVSVLAAGTKLKSNGEADTGARTVTLALQTDVLSKVALASRLGTISLAIRNPADQGMFPEQSATLGTLIGAANLPGAPAPVRSATAVQAGGIVVYAGKDRSVLHVP